MSSKNDKAPRQKDGVTRAQCGSEICEVGPSITLQADQDDSWKLTSFEDLGLGPSIVKSLYSIGFNRPSKIQNRALPILLANPTTNMILQSHHGTGKTTALILYILSRLDLAGEQQRKTPQAIVLVHHRESSGETVRLFRKFGQFLKDLIVINVSEHSMPSNKRPRPEASVLVGTPGTILDLIKKRILIKQNLKILVLDEVDIMLDLQGLRDQSLRVKHLLPPTIQIILSSVTFPENVSNYAKKIAPNANKLYLNQAELIAEGVKQVYIDFENANDKIGLLVDIYGLITFGPSIIYVNTCKTGYEIEKQMRADGFSAAYLIGDVENSERSDIIDSFCSGSTKVLITSYLHHDIDQRYTTMVINYDIGYGRYDQPDIETYLHRSRYISAFNRKGIYFSFVGNDAEREKLMDIKKSLHTDMFCIHIKDIWDDADLPSKIRPRTGNESYKIGFEAAKTHDAAATKTGLISSGFPMSSAQKSPTPLPPNAIPRQNLVQQVETQSPASAVYTNAAAAKIGPISSGFPVSSAQKLPTPSPPNPQPGQNLVEQVEIQRPASAVSMNTASVGAQVTMIEKLDYQHITSTGLTRAKSLSSLLVEDDKKRPKKKYRETDKWIDQFQNLVKSKIKSTSIRNNRMKVAILDSGIDMKNTDIGGYADAGRIKNIRSWIDGKDGAETEDCVDLSGHGTHIGGIILDLAPNVDVYIAQVTATHDLADTEVVVEAFEYAWKVWKADIITMSLGFPKGIPRLQEDIRIAVHKGTIVFAAASNDGGNSPIAFPASLSEVICVHSTPSHGTMAPYNPSPDRHPRSFSILGQHVKSPLANASVAGACSRMSGTSVATPVAVATAAFLIGYIQQEIPGLETSIKLKSSDSICSVFQLLASANGLRPGGYNLIAPFQFFDKFTEGKIREDIKHALNSPYRPG